MTTISEFLMSRYLVFALAAFIVSGDVSFAQPPKRPYSPPVWVPPVRGPRMRPPANDNTRRPSTPSGTPRRRPQNTAGDAGRKGVPTKTVIPLARSQQVLQARAAARQNSARWRNALRVRLQARVRAQRAQVAAAEAKERSEEDREKRERDTVLTALRIAGADSVMASIGGNGGQSPSGGGGGGTGPGGRQAANDNNRNDVSARTPAGNSSGLDAAAIRNDLRVREQADAKRKFNLLTGTSLSSARRRLPLAEAETFVKDWYRASPYNADKSSAPSSTGGTDFKKPVYFTRLAKGQRISSWAYKNSLPGRHFTIEGTDPNTLAILDLDKREEQVYVVASDEVYVVESTVEDFKPGIVPGVGGKGGGQQFILPRDWDGALTRVK